MDYYRLIDLWQYKFPTKVTFTRKRIDRQIVKTRLDYIFTDMQTAYECVNTKNKSILGTDPEAVGT